MEILIAGFLIALSATFIVDYSNIYKYILKGIPRLDVKPFNCSLCVSFWVAFIFTVFMYNSVLWITLPFVTGMMQIVVSRLIGLLPITFND